MTPESRQAALEAAGLAHPSPEAVTAPLFSTGTPFFFRLDKIQVNTKCCALTWWTASM